MATCVVKHPLHNHFHGHRSCWEESLSKRRLVIDQATLTPEGWCVISGHRREVRDSCALLGHYAASSGNFLPTFRENLPVPQKSVRNYHYLLCNNQKRAQFPRCLSSSNYSKVRTIKFRNFCETRTFFTSPGLSHEPYSSSSKSSTIIFCYL
jgi:hypothetical protein